MDHIARELEANSEHAPFSNWFIKSAIKTMMVHVDVYVMADKFNILGLKDYAQNKFQLLTRLMFWEWFSNPGLMEVFLKVIQSTPSNDKGLHRIIVDLSASNLDMIMGSKNDTEDHEKSEMTRAMWEPVFKEDKDFQYDVLRKSTQGNSERLVKSIEVYLHHIDDTAW